jgi:hypothetical protein
VADANPPVDSDKGAALTPKQPEKKPVPMATVKAPQVKTVPGATSTAAPRRLDPGEEVTLDNN